MMRCLRPNNNRIKTPFWSDSEKAHRTFVRQGNFYLLQRGVFEREKRTDFPSSFIYLTVIVQAAVRPSAVAVIVASPGAMPVIVPSAATVAMDSSLDFQ